MLETVSAQEACVEHNLKPVLLTWAFGRVLKCI